MHRIGLLGLVGWMLLGSTVVLRGQEPFPEGIAGELYYAARIDAVGLVVDLDGELTEEAWERAPFQQEIAVLEAAPEGPEDFAFRWAAVADDEFLYVAVEVTDDVAKIQENVLCEVWQDDSIEVYIDANNDGPECGAAGTSCYQADDGQITVGRLNDGVGDPDQLEIGGQAGSATCDFVGPSPEVCQGVVLDEGDIWVAELAIPLVTEGNLDILGDPDGTPTWSIVPDHGCRIGFSMQANDDDDATPERDSKAVWAVAEMTAESAWRNPGIFGKLVFVDPTQPLPLDPVSNLVCTRNGDGTVDVTWENPPEADPAGAIAIIVDGSEEESLDGDATSITLTAEQVPQNGQNHTIVVNNGTCTPASCVLDEAPFDACGAIRKWNLLGAYAGTNGAPGEDMIRMDYLTDGVTTEDDFVWIPGQTIETDFGGAALSTGYNDGLGNLTPTVEAYEGDTGFLDFLALYNGQTDVMTYAQCYVINNTGEEMEVYWADASDDSIQVKLNGVEVWISNLGRGGVTSCEDGAFPLDKSPDNVTFFDPLVLIPGENRLLVKVFQGTGDWNFIGRFQDEFDEPVTEGLNISLIPSGENAPVLNLSCVREADGTVTVSWTNPESADPAEPIEFRVDGVDLGRTVPGDSTSATLTEEEVPRDGLDHVVAVINDSGLARTCRVERDLAISPPELQVEGGELYINAGGSVDVDDLASRTWKADEPYLAPGHADTNTDAFGGQVIDATLLDDGEIPNAVLLAERWCDCNIQYQMQVPDGDYSVTLYFSENCEGCVNANLGGTGADGTARIFDIQVEDELIEAYTQADEAIPPGDDGVGAIFTATEVVFEVGVTDGLLDISIVDRGAGNPPENAAIKAIAIQRPVNGGDPQFRRGDGDANGVVNITDGIYVLNFLFLGGPPPPCRDAADADDNGAVNITDGIYILNFLFLGGPPPPSPGQTDCGIDPTQPNLGCETYESC